MLKGPEQKEAILSILLLGTHGQANQGDELLLESFLTNLQDLNQGVRVNSYTPGSTKDRFRKFNITTFHTRRDKALLLWYLLTSKAVVFAGGSVIKELNAAYGGKPYATLSIIDEISKAARAFRKPIFFSNIGIGPLSTIEGKRISARILNRAALITVRDIESVKYARLLGMEDKVTHTPDAAFSLDREYFGLEHEPAPASKGQTPKMIMINVTRNIGNPDNWAYYYDRLKDSLVRLDEVYSGVKFVGLAMQEHESANDYELLRLLKQDLVALRPKISFEIPRLDDAKEVARVIDASDLIIAEKLHAVILAAILCKPFVALEYDVKVKGVCSDLGMSGYSVDICSKFPKDAILTAATRVWEQIDTIQTKLIAVSLSQRQKSQLAFAELRAKLR
jgi:polysaccharide pyruvyl transferase WcaK-like protein